MQGCNPSAALEAGAERGKNVQCFPRWLLFGSASGGVVFTQSSFALNRLRP